MILKFEPLFLRKCRRRQPAAHLVPTQYIISPRIPSPIGHFIPLGSSLSARHVNLLDISSSTRHFIPPGMSSLLASEHLLGISSHWASHHLPGILSDRACTPTGHIITQRAYNLTGYLITYWAFSSIRYVIPQGTLSYRACHPTKQFTIKCYCAITWTLDFKTRISSI